MHFFKSSDFTFFKPPRQITCRQWEFTVATGVGKPRDPGVIDAQAHAGLGKKSPFE